MSETILVAGATGRLGREVIRELSGRGCRIRAMARSRARADLLRDEVDEIALADALKPETLEPAMRGVDRVFSCVGASVIPMPKYGGKSFSAVDYPANRNLIDAARAASVRKFLYVSVFGAERLPHRDFVRGHEKVVEALRSSGLDYAVVRPTGFFQSMEEILLVASRGLLPEFAGGSARTNPIHEADLAEFCVSALFDPRPSLEQDVGGPDVLSRREIARLAAEAAGREARIVKVPVGVLRGAGFLFRPFSPRVGHLMSFIADILVEDFEAPCFGRRHIADYFQERAAELRGTAAPA